MRAVTRSHGGPIDCGNLVGGVWEEPMIVGTLSLYSDSRVTCVTVTCHSQIGFPPTGFDWAVVLRNRT